MNLKLIHRNDRNIVNQSSIYVPDVWVISNRLEDDHLIRGGAK